MRRYLSLIVAGIMLLGMLGTTAFAQELTVAGTPRAETLVVESLVGIVSNPSQSNPHMSGTIQDRGLHQLVYSNLWDMDTINGVQIPDLAAELPIPLNDDYTSFKIVLTEGIKWSDGEDFDAEDVVFTINELLRHKEVLSNGAWLSNIVASAEYVDKYELIINTVNSRPRISEDLGVTVFGNNLRIVPEHYWKDSDLTSDPHEDPIGTGPYTIAGFDPNGYWFLYELREDAEFSDVGVLTGKVPAAKYVLVTAYGTEEKKTMAMLNNEVDILCDISPEAWEVLLAGNDNVACWLPDYPYGCFDDPCERGIAFNCDVAPFDNRDVRWAMALSLDIVQVSMDTFSGQMRVSPLCMPPTTFLSEAFHKEMRDELTAYAWEDGYQPFDRDFALKLKAALADEGIDSVDHLTEDELVDLFGVGWWKHDPAKAEELLIGAGLSRDGDGFWTYEGERVSFEVLSPSGYETQSERLAYACQSQWYDFGFDVTVQASESGFFHSVNGVGEFTAGSYWPSCGVMQDLYTQLFGWHSKLYTPSGSVTSGTFTRFRSEKLDAILDTMEKIPSGEETYELSKEALMVMADEAAWLPMFGTSKLVPTNSTYWTNYPDSEKPYNGPWWWWSCFKFIVNEIVPAQ